MTEIFDLRPKAIEERLKLRNPIYQETASYGHMGRNPRIVKKAYTSTYWPAVEKEVELFTWEKLDYADEIKRTFKPFREKAVQPQQPSAESLSGENSVSPEQAEIKD